MHVHIIDDAQNVRDYIFTKAILFAKISSLENYRLYGIAAFMLWYNNILYDTVKCELAGFYGYRWTGYF